MLFIYISEVGQKNGGRVPEYYLKKLETTRSPRLYVERATASELLCLAAERHFGIRTEELSILETKNGKPVCREFFVSVAHRYPYAVIAVSDAEVGVDIELEDELGPSKPERFAERFFTERERRIYASEPTPRRLLAIWTAKESLFKRIGGERLEPSRLDTAEREDISSFALCLEGKPVISVSSETPEPDDIIFVGDGGERPIDAEKI